MQTVSTVSSGWLRSYYFVRAVFSIAWVAAAVLFVAQPGVVTFLYVVYPLWDAVANVADARANGGLRANPSQTLNMAVSTITAIAVVVAVGIGAQAVLGVFGVWAILSGILQLYTAVRRWRLYGAQWVMTLSGAQSALAGGFMISRSIGTATPTILDIAPYAGFGAFYFLLSAIWMTVAAYRKAHA